MNLVVRKWGEQIVRSRQYAAGIALVAAFFSFFNLPIGWLSTVILALVTLQNGPRQGLIIMAWAVLPAVAMLCLGQYTVFINILLLHYLVVWSFASLLRKYNSWVNVLQIAALLGIFATIAIYYFAPDLQVWLVDQLTSMAKDYKTVSVFNFHPADVDLWVKYMALLATGLLGIAIILTNLMVLFLARWWQSTIVPIVSLQKECYVVRIHYLASLLLICLISGLYVNSSLFINVVIIALVPFVLAGLSLLHAYSATKKNGNAIMFVFYMLLLFLSPYVVPLLSLMGWLDSFINFRKRFVADNAIIEK